MTLRATAGWPERRWRLLRIDKRRGQRPNPSGPHCQRRDVRLGDAEELRIPASTPGVRYVPVSPPGVIAGAVIRAGRLSANITRRHLARNLSVRQATIRGWEAGTIPLSGVPYGQICLLAKALTSAGSAIGIGLNELLLACQCDVMIAGMLSGDENYAEVPPIGENTPEGKAASALLRWAAQGAVPSEYGDLLPTAPLLAAADVRRLAEVAHELTTGAFGHDLAVYGTAFLNHIGAVRCSAAAEGGRASSYDASNP